MKNVVISPTPLRPNGARTIDSSFVYINLPFYISEIKNEKTWFEADRNAITIFKTNILKIILIALRKNAEIQTHKAASNIIVQILEGKMIFKTDTQTMTLTQGDIITLQNGLSHSIMATEETVFLLTLSSSSLK